MATNRTLLIALRDRLLACGGEVPPRAESFHREHAALLAEVERALSWRGLLGRGRSAARLAPRVEALAARGEALRVLFGRLAQIEGQLGAAAATLERISAPALRDPDAIPAALERLGLEARRLGRQVKTDDDLMVDERRCESLRTEGLRLAEALGLWLSAETVLAGMRAGSRTAALEAALPELGERLCRAGATPEWQAEVRALVDPLEQLARREQPREITQTERIIKALPRWARALGEDCDACDALSERFKARRKDWPGEDDRTFEELFEQACLLERGLVERAAAARRDALAGLGARCALFAQLVGPDPGLAELVRDLGRETPADPRDYEDWCEQLRDANAAFQHRVKRSENALLASLGSHLGDCRQRLEALGPIPRLNEREAELAGLRERFEALARAAPGFDPLALLHRVEQARDLGAALEALEAGIRGDHAGLKEGYAALGRRADWLEGRARALGIALPALPPGIGAAPDLAASRSLEAERLELARQDRLLSAAEARFAQDCAEEGDAGSRRIGEILTVLGPETVGAAHLDPPPIAPVAPGDLRGSADRLGLVRTRLAAAADALAARERRLRARAAELQGVLTLIPAQRLGQQDRNDRDAILRQCRQWHQDAPDQPADPVERLRALAELVENAGHVEQRIESAARRLRARCDALAERLRRFNGRFLQGYCPDLYGRVESLVHPPTPTHWPRGAQEAQVQEAERLLCLLERQAQRLAAREIGETLQRLERHARRTRDPGVQALVAEVLGLPPERQPPARLRQRLADQLRALDLEAP